MAALAFCALLLSGTERLIGFAPDSDSSTSASDDISDGERRTRRHGRFYATLRNLRDWPRLDV